MEKAKPKGKQRSSDSPQRGKVITPNLAELEKALQQRTLQLESITHALEGFTYSVSHDLRAPLRAVTGFTEALSNEFGATLHPRAKDYLERICKSGERMNRMLEQLLRFSRTARSEPAWQNVNLSKIALEISGSLQLQTPERSVAWVIQPELTARADERWLRTVLEILLQNAWKFTSQSAQARIEFGFRDSEKPAYFVRDDGTGFDGAYADKLFFPFQRLHPPDEFPGEGMGLAIARRLIGRLEGRIWAESQVNRGATFFFSLGE